MAVLHALQSPSRQGHNTTQIFAMSRKLGGLAIVMHAIWPFNFGCTANVLLQTGGNFD